MHGFGTLLGAALPALVFAAAPGARAAAKAAQCERPAAAGVATPRPAPAVDAAVVRACAVDATGIDLSRTTLVDARRDGGLRTAIPGSLAADIDADAPPFGAGQPVVLIGDAADVRRLLGQCARLHAAGYANVRVLAGGFGAWRRLAGAQQDPQRSSAVTMTAGALERQAAVAPRTIVFDATADTGLHRLGTPSNVAGRGEAPGDAARRIAKDLRRRGVVPGVDPIAVVLPDRAAIDAWRDAWDATAYPEPRFYIGADTQFRADLARDERIAAERGKPLPGPCDR